MTPAPVWRVLVQRDGTSSNGTTSSDEGDHLSTGAIIGIACGAGALFLGSITLFVIYWRKQRRYDTEGDGYYPDEETAGHFNTSTAAPVYTLDYKGGGSESVAPTPQTSHTAQSGFTPLIEMASAMPTHPAYIPRALVRANSEKGSMSPVSGTASSQFSSISSRRQKADTELTAIQTGAAARRDTPERRPTNQTYEEYESDAREVETQPRYGHRRRPSVGTGIPGPIPVPVPALTMPTYPSAVGGRRKQYSPPRLNLNTAAPSQQNKYINTTAQAVSGIGIGIGIVSNNDKVPISAVDISGPLAFPPQPAPPPPPPIQLGGPRQQQEHHQQYQKELEIQLQLEQQQQQHDQRYYNHHGNNSYYYEESSSAPDSHGNQYRGGGNNSHPPNRGRSFRDRSLSSRGGTSRSRSNRGGDRSDYSGGGGGGGNVDPYYYSSSSGGGGNAGRVGQGQQYQHHQYQQQQPTHYEEVEIGRNSDDDIW